MKRFLVLFMAISLVCPRISFSLAPRSNYYPNQPLAQISFELTWNDSLGTSGVYTSEFEKVSQEKIQKLFNEDKYLKIKWDVENKAWKLAQRGKKGYGVFTKKIGQINEQIDALNDQFQKRLIPRKYQDEAIEIVLLNTRKHYIVRKDGEVQLARAGTRNGKGIYIYIPVLQFLDTPIAEWIELVLEEELDHALKKFEARKKGKDLENETFQPEHLEKLKKLAKYIDSTGMDKWLKNQTQKKSATTAKKAETSPSKTELLTVTIERPKVNKISKDSIKPLPRSGLFKYANGTLDRLDPFEDKIELAKNKYPQVNLAYIEPSEKYPKASFIGLRNGIPNYLSYLQEIYPRYKVPGHSDKKNYEERLKVLVVPQTMGSNKVLNLYAPVSGDWYVKLASYWFVQIIEGEEEPKIMYKELPFLHPRELASKLNLRELIDIYSVPLEETLRERSDLFGELLLKFIRETIKYKENQSKLSEIKEDFVAKVRSIGGFEVVVYSKKGTKFLSFPTYVFNLSENNTGYPINLGAVRGVVIRNFIVDGTITTETTDAEKEELIQEYFRKIRMNNSQYSGEVDLTPFIQSGGTVDEGNYIAVPGDGLTFKFHANRKESGISPKPVPELFIKIVDDLVNRFDNGQADISEPYVELPSAPKLPEQAVQPKKVKGSSKQETTPEKPKKSVEEDKKETSEKPEKPPVEPIKPPVVEEPTQPVEIINLIRSQSEKNHQALLQMVIYMIERLEKDQKRKKKERVEKLADLRKEFGPIFRSIGPILVEAKEDDGPENLFSGLSESNHIVDGERQRFLGAVGWTEITDKYSDLIQLGKEVLLIPKGDLSYDVAVEDDNGVWRRIQGATLKVTDHFEERLVARTSDNHYYLDLDVNAKKGSEPFVADSYVNLVSLFDWMRSDSEQALQISSPISDLIFDTSDTKKGLLKLVKKMVQCYFFILFLRLKNQLTKARFNLQRSIRFVSQTNKKSLQINL